MIDIRKTLLGQDASKVKNALVIESEEQAWELLKKLVDGEGGLPNDIVFGDWAKLDIYLKGDPYNQSLTPSVFPVYTELQKQVHQTYAKFKYGDRTKRLSDDEKRRLQVVITIKNGSSDTSTPFDVTEILSGMANKMTPEQVFCIAIFIVFCWAGSTIYSKYIHDRAATRLIESKSENDKEMLRHIEVLGEQDIKRIEIFAKAMQGNQDAREIWEKAEQLQKQKLKTATKVDETNISGVYLEGYQAQELVKTVREKPVGKRLNGNFDILKLNWDDDEFTDITLRHIVTKQEVTATFRTNGFSSEKTELIRTKEWKKLPIYAEINTRVLKGMIVSADLISVKDVAHDRT